jgi:hypothetical protein
LIGRTVLTANNRRLGRLQECRAERRGDRTVVLEWMVGPAGLLERLGLGARMVLGPVKPTGYLVRWDQLDLTNPEQPRLSCPVDDLERL